ncbi:MAG: arylsulfotransferase family protein [Planctomycetota bacterium]|jgi:hypothetical protein
MTRPAHILLLFATLGACLPACGDAGSGAPTADPGAPEGRWHTAREERIEAQIEELSAVAYLSGTKPARERNGILAYDEERAWDGLNLYTSGHAPVAILMDMEGQPLHEWRCPFERAMPGYREERLGQKDHFRRYFRRVELLDDGDLLAIFEGHALVKLDRQSNLQWVFDGGAHHDLQVVEDGSIYVLSRTPHMVERINPDEPVLEDFVSILDADGHERERLSILEAFERSEHAGDLATMKRAGDLLHTNTLEVLDGRLADRIPAFAAGNLLISCLKISTIAVIDPGLRKVVWSAKGTWRRQHQPTVLDDGRLMLFDNLGRREGEHGRSRVLELDPVSLEIGWRYQGTAAQPFQSDTCGSCQRLPNGNTLITESDYGRAFEVDADGRTVWEFVSPHRVEGEQGALVATLFELIRIEREDVAGWLDPR